DLVRDRLAADFFDLFDASGERDILKFLHLPAFVEAHCFSRLRWERGSHWAQEMASALYPRSAWSCLRRSPVGGFLVFIISMNASKGYAASWGPGEASGWYWTQNMGSVLWRKPSTVPSLRFTCVTTPPLASSDFFSTAKPWFWLVISTRPV